MFDAVGDVETALAKLIASEGPFDVVRLNTLRNQFESVWLRAIEEYDRSEDWADEGFAKAASALRVKCRMAQGVANHSLKLARKVRQMPHVAHAFETGELSRDHVARFAEAFTPKRMPVMSQIEDRLVDAAKIATPNELREILCRYTDALDGDDGAARANDEYELRQFHISRTLNGRWRGDFEFDDEEGQFVNNAVNAMVGRPVKGDTRTAEQKRADAFINLMRAATSKAKFPKGRRPRADISAHIDISEIERRNPHVALDIRQHAHGLSRATLRRLSCDCTIARVITDGPSQVLDVGRATRTVPVATRRALETRDGGCTWDNCNCPALWCDAHHIWHWEDGGPTNLDNLRLLCTHHHHKLHMQEGGPDPP